MQLFKYLCFCSLGFALLYSCSKDEPTLRIDEEEEVIDTIPEFDPAADWMQQLFYEYPTSEPTLKDICMPRSHDAGTYILQNCSIGANECNTQTQYLNMKRQLEEGIRVYDIRPVLLNNVYFTHHTTGCEDGLGCNGDRIENMLNQLSDFLDDHVELVILEFGHWCETGPNDPNFQDLVTGILGDRMYKDTSDNTIKFIERPLGTIIPPDAPTGKVLVKMIGISNSADNRSAGFFASSYISVSGSYANSYDFETMKADQFNKYRNYNNSPASLFEISWTQTLDAELSVACAFPFNNPSSIRDFAEYANARLIESIDELIMSGDLYQGRIPNVIGVDFCDRFVTNECMRISQLNLE